MGGKGWFESWLLTAKELFEADDGAFEWLKSPEKGDGLETFMGEEVEDALGLLPDLAGGPSHLSFC